MTTDELNEMRILTMAAHAIIPLIQEKQKMAYEKLLMSFRTGNDYNLAGVAECNAYSTILDDINMKLINYEQYHEENRK